MTATGSSLSARPTVGRRRSRFGLVWTVIMLGVGFYGGIRSTKWAMHSAPWIQHLYGLEVVPPPVVAPPVAAVRPAPAAAPQTAPAAPVVPPTVPPAVATAAATPVPSSTPPSPVPPQGSSALVGAWEITDQVRPNGGPATKVTSEYVFSADSTGSYSTNGKKMYDFHWEVNSDDMLMITYMVDSSPTISMRWSVDAAHTLLTLVLQEGKDARAEMYGIEGPAVYHHKG